MAFLAPKLTEAGKEIYYQNMAGKQMKFKAIKLGSGEISGPDEIPGLTDLKQPVIDIPHETKRVCGDLWVIFKCPIGRFSMEGNRRDGRGSKRPGQGYFVLLSKCI